MVCLIGAQFLRCKMNLTKLPAELGKVGAGETAAGDLHEMSGVNRWLAELEFTALSILREQQHFLSLKALSAPARYGVSIESEPFRRLAVLMSNFYHLLRKREDPLQRERA